MRLKGGWGVGKTFVIEEIEKKLEVIQSEETSGDKYFVFHYNCWQHDYYEEPAVAIISAMFSSIREDGALFNEEVDTSIKTGYEVVYKKFKDIAGVRVGQN